MWKRLSEALSGARRLEWWALLVAIALAALLLLSMSGSKGREMDGSTALEARLTQLIEHIEGTGRTRVMITEGRDGITGAAIVCEDLTDIGAYLEIQAVVQALLNIDLSRIQIIGRRDTPGGAGG